MNYFPPGMSPASPILVIMHPRQSIAQAAQQADEIKVKFRERVDTETDRSIQRSATRKRDWTPRTSFGDGPVDNRQTPTH
jgi:hypothetical protein